MTEQRKDPDAAYPYRWTPRGKRDLRGTLPCRVIERSWSGLFKVALLQPDGTETVAYIKHLRKA